MSDIRLVVNDWELETICKALLAYADRMPNGTLAEREERLCVEELAARMRIESVWRFILDGLDQVRTAFSLVWAKVKEPLDRLAEFWWWSKGYAAGLGDRLRKRGGAE